MSSINTNGMNVNYPVSGINNSTQGFRDNFSSIKNNLDTAASELTDLQNKVVLKSALTGTSLNNDMANSLISNALTKSFRASTYNLGNNISGTVTVNVSQGDVQYGTITANTTLQFGGWAPVGTQSNVQLQFSIANANAYITLPNTTTDVDNLPNAGMTFTALQLENYFSNATPTASGSYTNIIGIPNGVSQVNYTLSTTNCGTTVDILPINRNQKATFIGAGTPNVSNVSATGTITVATTSPAITGTSTLFTTELVVGRAMLNSSNVLIGYIANIGSNTSANLTANSALSITGGSYRRQLPIGNPGDTLGTFQTDGTYVYVCTANYAGGNTTVWKRITPSSY